MRRIIEYFTAGLLLGLLYIGGVFSGKVYYEPAKVVPVPAGPTVYNYIIYHTDEFGKKVENTVEANAVDVHGVCVIFYKDFHVTLVLCPGPDELVVLEQ